MATKEDVENLQQQIAQLCARLEQTGIFQPPHPTIGRQRGQTIVRMLGDLQQ